MPPCPNREELFSEIVPMQKKFTTHANKLCQRLACEPQDLVQEAMIKIWRMLHHYRKDGPAKLTTWAWTVARNAMFTHVRKIKRATPNLDPVIIDCSQAHLESSKMSKFNYGDDALIDVVMENEYDLKATAEILEIRQIDLKNRIREYIEQ